MLIRVSIEQGPSRIVPQKDVEAVTFASLAVVEADIEEFLRKHIGLLFEADEERTLLIVGQQVRNAQNGRNDLVALEGNGNLVLIEIKRDATDASSRAEALEFQAVRYAASLATIKGVDDLVEKLFVRYIQHHASEFQLGALTPEELGRRIVVEFLGRNGAQQSFNRGQSIILVSSTFDPQTLSAAAWMSTNGIDIECIALKPVQIGSSPSIICLDVQQIVPLPGISDVLVGFANSGTSSGGYSDTGQTSRTRLPKMADLLQWQVVRPGQILKIKGYDDSAATVINSKRVRWKDTEVSYIDWGRSITGWSSINIYEWTVDESGQTLAQLRAERMKQDAAGASAQVG